MSRISRYQESIEKFIKNKNINNYFAEEFSKDIEKKLTNSDHLCGIILSTIFNHNTKKSNIKGHGYFLGILIDICLIMINFKNISLDMNTNLIIGLYKLLNENLQILKSDDSDKLNIISNNIYNYFNSYIYTIFKNEKYNFKKMTKSDLLNLKTLTPELYKKISNMNKYDQNDFMDHIKNKYGNLGKMIIVLSWIMGGGNIDKKTLLILEGIGEKFGLIYKVCIDFENVISDIKNSENITNNTIVNIGVQESFELFMELKSSFYEESLKLEIYTHTMKEVIDELEMKMDKCIENCKVDMKSTYSSFSK
jgi:hypothetical protein